VYLEGPDMGMREQGRQGRAQMMLVRLHLEFASLLSVLQTSDFLNDKLAQLVSTAFEC